VSGTQQPVNTHAIDDAPLGPTYTTPHPIHTHQFDVALTADPGERQVVTLFVTVVPLRAPLHNTNTVDGMLVTLHPVQLVTSRYGCTRLLPVMVKEFEAGATMSPSPTPTAVSQFPVIRLLVTLTNLMASVPDC